MLRLHPSVIDYVILGIYFVVVLAGVSVTKPKPTEELRGWSGG